MGKRWSVLFLFCSTWAWGADVGGGAEAKAENGRLAVLSSWLESEADWAARWWWRESGGGTAWVRAWGIQAGPLVPLSCREGLKSWGHRSDLASGNWGVAVDEDSWGIWAVQSPETFETGAQSEVVMGSLSLAAGGDRTWELDPGTRRWTDRGRAGLGWDGTWWEAGGSVGAAVPDEGTPGLSWTYRWSAGRGPWDAAWKGTFGAEGDPGEWTAAGDWGWDDWEAGWKGWSGDPGGRWSLGYFGDPWTVAAHWGPVSGYGARAALGLLFSPVELGLSGQASWTGRHWTGKAGLSACAPWNGGRWVAGWTVGPGTLGPVHTVTAGWRQPSFEAEGRWTAEGPSLGWIGPKSKFTLTLRYLF